MVGDRSPEADGTVGWSYTGAGTRTACREEHPQVCDQIHVAIAEVRRRTPLAGLRGTPEGRCSRPSPMGLREALAPGDWHG